MIIRTFLSCDMEGWGSFPVMEFFVFWFAKRRTENIFQKSIQESYWTLHFYLSLPLTFSRKKLTQRTFTLRNELKLKDRGKKTRSWAKIWILLSLPFSRWKSLCRTITILVFVLRLIGIPRSGWKKIMMKMGTIVFMEWNSLKVFSLCFQFCEWVAACLPCHSNDDCNIPPNSPGLWGTPSSFVLVCVQQTVELLARTSTGSM